MRSKTWGRRHLGCGSFLCRLITLWALLVIIILYNTFNSPSSTDNYETIKVESKVKQALTNQDVIGQLQDATVSGQVKVVTRQLSTRLTKHQKEIWTTVGSRIRRPSKLESDMNSDERTASEGVSKVPALSTTKKSPASEYLRQSEIFILIIQNEGVNNVINKQRNNDKVRGGLYPTSDVRVDASRHRLFTMPHIRQLTDLLEAHKIGYAIDSTRFGLPTELLQNPRKYSVIIIDDFLRYGSLNRWVRDQLDRFCRTNRIGVLTYLNENKRFYVDDKRLKDVSNDSVQKRNIEESTSSTKFFTEQMPITYEPIELNCIDATSITCLTDYQLNDKAQLLRILKNKSDFIVKGELINSLGVESVVALSSNHVTYEPLTWARLRRPQLSNTLKQKRHTVLDGTSKKKSKFVTQYANVNDQSVGVAHLQKRAVLESLESSTSKYTTDSKAVEQVPDLDNNHTYSSAGSVQLELSNSSNPTSMQPIGLTQETRGVTKVLAMIDNGLYDDIKRVIFGITTGHWLNKLLLLDSIEHLSSGGILTPLERFIQIDIDDIFVGASGTRLNFSDVRALIETQNEFAYLIENGFKFNLGFSGKYFKHGNEYEQMGDEELVRNADKFTWFCHFWSHSKAHMFNDTEKLSNELLKNLKFAEDKKLTLIGHSKPPSANGYQTVPTYAVAPHHSGVYPIHETLYEAWRSILNVQVTSTEEYPHLRPSSRRRGFVHETIKVLPRQTCGLYTHTIFRDKYPGGFDKLLASIRGGELFSTVLHNPVNIYMSHMSNYANDRLALFTFKSLIKFVRENTNLRLKYADSNANAEEGRRLGPMLLADYYFKLNPSEREPLWTNPCEDKRHLDIWATSKQSLCELTPKLLIVGPQKTGTTALQSFINLNPSIRTSQASRQDFEEVQFFNDKHYFKGVDWYLKRFLGTGTMAKDEDTDSYVFLDKSATYFDDPKVPQRASALLPNAHILILLTNPADRAHSWYQHIRAHGNAIANEWSFFDVITYDDSTPDSQSSSAAFADSLQDSSVDLTRNTSTNSRRLTNNQAAAVKALRNRCLHPGYYSSHLLRWLDYYQSHQIVIIDGEWFKLNPAAVLGRLQQLLRLPQKIDYTKLLSYSKTKGYFCMRDIEAHNKTDSNENFKTNESYNHGQQTILTCLGSGKGRKYSPMSEEARTYLNNHYLQHNRQLARLLYEIGQPLPNWLDQSINPLPTGRLL